MQPDDKIMKYFRSLKDVQANYENVPKTMERGERQHFVGHQFHCHQTSKTRRSSPTHHHGRSHSHHYYNAMLPPPDYINYCNLPPHLDASYPMISLANRSRHSTQPALIGQPTAPLQQRRAQLDSMTVMRLGVELGFPIDASPMMPPSRSYSIIESRNGNLHKLPFPHSRVMAIDVIDPQEDIHIRKGDLVTVLGPSNEDRSKFTVCYKKGHIEVPHQYTQQPIAGYNGWRVL